MNLKDFKNALNSYYENTGWQGVWTKNYSRIQKLNLTEKKRLRLTLEKRFGPNMKQMFREELYRTDYLFRKIS